MVIRSDLYSIINMLIIIFTIFTSQSFTALSSAASDNSALMQLITHNEDSRMGVKDLAFFLVTHDFDAAPKKEYVEVQIDDTLYVLVPNGQSSGLADVTVASRNESVKRNENSKEIKLCKL